eukprot:9311601-Pyramimonas_sp.AAC.1
MGCANNVASAAHFLIVHNIGYTTDFAQHRLQHICCTTSMEQPHSLHHIGCTAWTTPHISRNAVKPHGLHNLYRTADCAT